MATFTITGKVVRKADNRPLSKVRIEAWDKNISAKELLSDTICGSAGDFILRFDRNKLAEMYKDRLPDVFFRVFSGDTLLGDTRSGITVRLQGKDTDVLIPIDYTPAAAKTAPAGATSTGAASANTAPANAAAAPEQPPYVVKGTILQQDNSPAIRSKVEAFDKGLVTDTPLASAETNEQGVFEISFPATAFAASGKNSPDIYCRVTTGKKQVHQTDIAYNAASVTTFQEVIGGAPFPIASEFELFTRKLDPIFKNVDVKAIRQDANNNPYRLLSEKTGEAEQKMKWMVTAHQLSAGTKLPPEFFYAMLQGQLATEPAAQMASLWTGDLNKILSLLQSYDKKETPQELPLSISVTNTALLNTLVAMPDDAVQGALDQAIQKGAIPAGFQAQRASATSAWEEYKKNYTPGGPAGSSPTAGGPSTTNPSGKPADSAPASSTTNTFAAKLSSDDSHHFSDKTSMLNFFESHPDLELHKVNLDLYFRKERRTLGDKFGDTDPLRTDLKKAQRIFRLTPSYEKAKLLLDHNIHSAQSIHNMGRKNFVDKVKGDVISEQEAKKIYKKAEKTHAAALAILGDIKSMEHASALKVLPDVKKTYNNLKHSTIKDFPDWATLFTSPDICECEECRSVYSPSSYLVDLLHFLNKQGSTTPGVTAKAILFKRRPDMGEIDLSCNNSETAIPYSDLVAEILEDGLADNPIALSNGIDALLTEGTILAGLITELTRHGLDIQSDASVTPGITATEWFVRDTLRAYKITKTGTQFNARNSKQTHGSVVERQAMPEYINYAAYDNVLKIAQHPITLPFDLSWEESRAYLDKLGIAKSDWMYSFRNKTALTPTDEQIAAEFLGLSPKEENIIVTTDTASQAAYWGGLADIDKVSVFLQRSGLEYTQLQDLLRLQFINPVLDSKIIHQDTSCDTEEKNISGLDAPRLDKINRFIRLWKKTDWQMWQLDQAIMNTVIGNGNLDVPFLIHLKGLIQLKTQLKLKPEEVLAYYGDLDTTLPNSIYKRLFRNKVLLDPLPDELREALVTESPFPNPAPADRTITAQLKTLTAVLKLKDEEAAQIQTRSLTDDNLGLSNISTFFRLASLTRKLRMTMKEYYILFDILNTGAALSVFQDPAATLSFLDIVAFIKAAHYNVNELAYLLLNRDEGVTAMIPTDKKITDFITTERDALQKIKDDLDSIIGLPDDIAKTLLGKLSTIGDDTLNTLSQIFNGTFTGTTVQRDAAIDNALGIIDTSTLKTKLNDRDAATADQKPQKTDEAYQELDSLLKNHLQLQAHQQSIYQAYATEFKLPDDISPILLSQATLQGSTTLLQDLWFNPSLFAKDAAGNYTNAVTQVNFPDLYNSYLLTNKIALQQIKMSFGTDTFGLLIAHAADLGIIPFNAFPLTTPVADSQFAKWKSYAELYQLSTLYIDNDNGSLSDTLTKALPPAATENDLLAAASAYTLWDLMELTALKTALGLNFPADYLLTATWITLDACMTLLTTTTVSASQVGLVINPAPTSTDAINIKQLVRSKYDNDQWLNTSGNIQSILRDRKRDALIDYYTHHTVQGNTFNDSNELFDYYMLDVEMGSQVPTARVLQAGLSVQVFVQRCLMNLETEVKPGDDDQDWLQWTWMKNYRVWEANRKVFLYPENWIEPELRLDKSSFFQDLENDLMQNEINQTNVENAYLSYLEKLDNVARLDVCGYYYEDETYTLHVFAHTYDDPYIYYYRTWVEDRYWTAWQKVDLEINSSQVVPIVINQRIYLYWPDFREVSEEADSTTMPALPGSKATSVGIDRPYKYWEIRLCVSEFRNEKWTPKKISRTFATTAATQDPVDKDTFSFLPIDLMDICDRYLVGCFENASPDDPTNYGYNAVRFFDLGSCHGTPEILDDPDVLGLVHKPIIPEFERSELMYLQNQETTQYPNDVLAFQQGHLLINHYPILRKTPGWFRAPVSAQLSFFDKFLVWLYWLVIQALNKQSGKHQREWPLPYSTGSFLPFFYEDKGRTFFVMQEFILRQRKPRGNEKQPMTAELTYTNLVQVITEFFQTGIIPDLVKPFFEDGALPAVQFRLKFNNFYHPYVCWLIKQFYKSAMESAATAPDGSKYTLDGFFKREVQLLDKAKYPEIKDFSFKDTYAPTAVVYPGIPTPTDPYPDYPKEEIDFSASGAYAEYNWELFFHAPLMLARSLSTNQRFEEAMHWFHYIFNPTDTSSNASPQKYWITKPFFQRSSQDYVDQRIDQILTMINSGDTSLIQDVDDWRRNAFQPHLIAQFRTVAYQKTVVMKYLDNLIAWGDNLFRTDSRENINEATQLYILAAEILGPKPQTIPKSADAPALNYNQLESKLDAFSNAMIQLENFIPALEDDIDQFSPSIPLPDLKTFYFCIPQNDQLLAYWDTIALRLFYIRNSMNIDGVVRSLALYDPPIDPGLLVKAVASGISLSAAIAGLNAALPYYRFQTMVQKAGEFCNEVKALATDLLAALEKKDTEALSLLRSAQEIRLLQATKETRQKQVDEAKENIKALQRSSDMTQEKKKYYAGLPFMNTGENVAFALSTASTILDAAIAAGYILAGGLKAIPQFIAGGSGFGGSPHVAVTIGGQEFGDVADAATKVISSVTHALDKSASLASTQGSYQRRQDEWDFQTRLADKELAQIDQQITAAQVRQAIAEKELENQELQIENAKVIDGYMRSKFTNIDLYNWMIGQVSATYFQTYQLALDMAKKAERCYRYELGIPDTSFIQAGYWDNLKKGLLSGERLCLDLQRMEASYHDQNKREFEITRHISLTQIDPMALLSLRETGQCFFQLPEEIFDLDYPGHYFRRIRSAGLSIPCIIGPYNNVNCTLTILKSRIRTSPSPANVDYSTPPTEDDPGFAFNFSSIQSIVTSNAQNDAGLFDTNMKDERYLPFEGHGCVSEWKLEINKDFKNFDLDTITDVVLHLKYTARQGGQVLADKVKAQLNANFDQIVKTTKDGTGFFKLISMKTDFPTELHRLLYSTASPKQVDIGVMLQHVPYWLSYRDLQIDDSVSTQVFLKAKQGQTINAATVTMKLNGEDVHFTPPSALGELHIGTTTQTGDIFKSWNIDTGAAGLDPVKLDDLLILFKYKTV